MILPANLPADAVIDEDPVMSGDEPMNEDLPDSNTNDVPFNPPDASMIEVPQVNDNVSM